MYQTMKEEVLHLKVPADVYRKLSKMAEKDHRTIHSLARHLFILGVEHEWRVRDDKPERA